MRKKLVYLLVSLVLIIIPLTACLPPSTPNPATPSPITAVQAQVAKIEQELPNKASVGQFTALDTRLSAAEGNINSLKAAGPGSGYQKAETYSKAEVDAAVKAAIDALKNNQTWITAAPVAPASPIYGTPAPVTPVPGGTVTMSTSPVSIPPIYSGMQGIAATFTGGTGCGMGTGISSLASFVVTPTGYVQPYTMRITNSSTVLQYVKPIITFQMSNTGGYYGGAYPQLTYFNISISSGYGQVQGTGTSNFYQAGGGSGSMAYCSTGTTSNPNFQGYCPSNAGTYNPTVQSNLILQNGWWLSSTSNPLITSAATYSIPPTLLLPQTPTVPSVISGGPFPISLSPSSANYQATPSFSFTTTGGLNGYGEYQVTPGQSIDLTIMIQVATLQQSTLQITNSISARQ